MFRDDQPTILDSIRASATSLAEAETAKSQADSAAYQAKEHRDIQRRILADRVVVAIRENVPQKLIAEWAGRTREWVRLTNLAYTDPETITATTYGPSHGSFRDWRVAAELAWTDTARAKGLEPKTLDDFDPTGNQVAQVLVYDREYVLELDDDTVRARRITEK